MVNSINEWDLTLLTNNVDVTLHNFQRDYGQSGRRSLRQLKIYDALRCYGSHMRYIEVWNEYIALLGRLRQSLKLHLDRDRLSQLLVLNDEFLTRASHDEFLISPSHHLALIASLAIVHTFRGAYQLSGTKKCFHHNDADVSPTVTRQKSIDPYHLDEGEATHELVPNTMEAELGP